MTFPPRPWLAPAEPSAPLRVTWNLGTGEGVEDGAALDVLANAWAPCRGPGPRPCGGALRCVPCLSRVALWEGEALALIESHSWAFAADALRRLSKDERLTLSRDELLELIDAVIVAEEYGE